MRKKDAPSDSSDKLSKKMSERDPKNENTPTSDSSCAYNHDSLRIYFSEKTSEKNSEKTEKRSENLSKKEKERNMKMRERSLMGAHHVCSSGL